MLVKIGVISQFSISTGIMESDSSSSSRFVGAIRVERMECCSTEILLAGMLLAVCNSVELAIGCESKDDKMLELVWAIAELEETGELVEFVEGSCFAEKSGDGGIAVLHPTGSSGFFRRSAAAGLI